jgi:hypothetical protein
MPRDARSQEGVVGIYVPNNVYDGQVFRQMVSTSGDEGWCLDVRFVNVNSQKTERFLTYLAEAGRAA